MSSLKTALSRTIVGLTAVLVFTSMATASPVTFTGSSGSRSALATFDVQGSRLLVHLVNNSPGDCLVPSDVLTAIFFDVKGSPALTPISATIAPDSIVYKGGKQITSGIQAGPDVSGEWAYHIGLAKAPNNATQGISSAGFNLFGPKDVFPGKNLSGPTSPSGIDYGLLSAGDIPATGNGGLMKDYLIKDAVDFVLSGLPSNFSSSAISNISFQYGTALTEGTITGHAVVPEPSGLALLGMTMPLLARWRKRLPREKAVPAPVHEARPVPRPINITYVVIR